MLLHGRAGAPARVGDGRVRLRGSASEQILEQKLEQIFEQIFEQISEQIFEQIS